MCGIAGLIARGSVDAAIAERFADALVHRGPDDRGVWIDARHTVALVHRRLAIVDLSPNGHQPMTSASERLVLSYNGEIYNHLAVRSELDATQPGIAWRSSSDTETLLEAIEIWGLDDALGRMVGMFAFALWDARDRQLHLVRDRFGEKPLYYGWAGRDFVFASELKAFKRHPDFVATVDRDAVAALASRNYIPAPLSIYREAFKLEPGCILTIAVDALPPLPHAPPHAPYSGDGLSIRRYWSYPAVLAEGAQQQFGSEAEALEVVGSAIDASIAGQAVADVPVGAFLSGGIDSSLVVARYQAVSGRPVLTFTIGMSDGFDEAHHAREVARHLGTAHTELYVSAAEARDVIPRLPHIYDEPFADSSQIPTFLVSQMARQHVTVSLSGDAGDELFGGYNRYFGVARAWNAFERLPRAVRGPAARLLAAVPHNMWTRSANALTRHPRSGSFGLKIKRTFETLAGAGNCDAFFAQFLDEWNGLEPPVAGAASFPAHAAHPWPDVAKRMMEADALDYLPGDILAKVDRAAMAVALETRVPFLDHRVAAAAARVPLAMNIAGGRGKLLLRTLLYRDVPPALIERPKAGFGVPVGAWLRGPLRDWAEALLTRARLADSGLWNTSGVRKLWDAHQSGAVDAASPLWSVLMFEAWREANR